ncbi:MAG: sulfotransferase [Myxococcota bacterium]
MTRVCAWSGPRNLSTALMRSFEARGDCEVVDEPLYAAYLAATGVDHPGRAEILASQPTDPAEVLRRLAVDGDRPVRFEKHMAHHWRPGWPADALGEARHLVLIRDPARVVASYAKVRESPEPAELGLLQQRSLVDRWTAEGRRVVIVDGDDLAAAPARVLPRLCDALGLPYTEAMTSWPPGRRATDGVWAPHWYGRVERSTGFAPSSEASPVPPALGWVVDTLDPAYRSLARDRVT